MKTNTLAVLAIIIGIIISACSRPVIEEIANDAHPSLIILCDINKIEHKAVFSRVLYNDGSVKVEYNKGDKIDIITNLNDGNRNLPDQILLIYTDKLIRSGPIENRLFAEYAIMNGVVVGQNIPMADFLKMKLAGTSQRTP